MSKRLIEIKDAILTVFGDYLGVEAENIIEDSVWEGDPYNWTGGRAVATVSLERGLPGFHMPAFIEMWMEVNEYLTDMHVENINGGVSAVYKDR